MAVTLRVGAWRETQGVSRSRREVGGSGRRGGGQGRRAGRRSGHAPALVLGLEEVRREVERPHAEEAVFAAGDREARGEVDGVDGALVEGVDGLERARPRVDDEEVARGGADEQTALRLPLGAAAVLNRRVEGHAEEEVVGLVLQRHAAAVQPAAPQPPEADVLVAAREQLMALEWRFALRLLIGDVHGIRRHLRSTGRAQRSRPVGKRLPPLCLALRAGATRRSRATDTEQGKWGCGAGVPIG